jgi:hypothetical protein
MGRPRKENAMKAGDLQPGYCRLSFICKQSVADQIRDIAKQRDVSIKNLMHAIITSYIDEIDSNTKMAAISQIGETISTGLQNIRDRVNK